MYDQKYDQMPAMGCCLMPGYAALFQVNDDPPGMIAT